MNCKPAISEPRFIAHIRRHLSKSLPIAVTLLVLAMTFAAPAFGQDATSIIKAKTQGAYNLTYTAVYGLLGIALLVSFLGALFGRMEWTRLAQVCLGIVGVGAIAAIIQFFSP